MSTKQATDIAWTHDLTEKLTEARKTGTPVLLDFSAAPM